ncbi:hypothetical protein JXJ21_20650 [candidate division KSB1 bacterium]|nr:hypothetical protein [candidate division KSB1 bacterium]
MLNDKNQRVNPNQSKRRQDLPKLFVVVLAVIAVLCIIIIYHYKIRNKLSEVNQDYSDLNSRIAKLEHGAVREPSVQQLEERLDYIQSQQEVTLTATQEMVDFMSFTFTLIGLFFLLVSGYFVYRQHRTENREDEGWVLAKQLLELVTESQQFVVQVQRELDEQQKTQEERQKQIQAQIEETIKFINDRADVLLSQFRRDLIMKGIHFARLTDISNRIDNTKFQLQTYGLSFNQNSYFLKAVYEYIIGDYNVAKDEFTRLIKHKTNRILTDTEKKQLSLCYYYRGLIEYNIQEHPVDAEKDMDSAIESDPEINGPDFKSRLLKAEIQLKLKKDAAFDLFREIKERLAIFEYLSDTQTRLLSYANLGMVYCKLLGGGLKFLPEYYQRICDQGDAGLNLAVQWLSESLNSHLYAFLTMGQLAVALEQMNKNLGLERSGFYFEKTYEILEKGKRYEVKEETRSKILAYSIKLVCENELARSTLENTRFMLCELLNDAEMKTVYSIFSKVNVSKNEFVEELKFYLGNPL